MISRKPLIFVNYRTHLNNSRDKKEITREIRTYFKLNNDKNTIQPKLEGCM